MGRSPAGTRSGTSNSSSCRQYTQNWLGVAVGMPTLRAIFEEKYYEQRPGASLEGLGRLFRGSVSLFAYPTLSAENGKLETAGTLALVPKLRHLYENLVENGFIEPIRQYSRAQLEVNPGEVLRRIQSGDATWVNFVPPQAAALIQRDGLFGLKRSGDSAR